MSTSVYAPLKICIFSPAVWGVCLYDLDQNVCSTFLYLPPCFIFSILAHMFYFHLFLHFICFCRSVRSSLTHPDYHFAHSVIVRTHFEGNLPFYHHDYTILQLNLQNVNFPFPSFSEWYYLWWILDVSCVIFRSIVLLCDYYSI